MQSWKMLPLIGCLPIAMQGGGRRPCSMAGGARLLGGPGHGRVQGGAVEGVQLLRVLQQLPRVRHESVQEAFQRLVQRETLPADPRYLLTPRRSLRRAFSVMPTLSSTEEIHWQPPHLPDPPYPELSRTLRLACLRPEKEATQNHRLIDAACACTPSRARTCAATLGFKACHAKPGAQPAMVGGWWRRRPTGRRRARLGVADDPEGAAGEPRCGPQEAPQVAGCQLQRRSPPARQPFQLGGFLQPARADMAPPRLWLPILLAAPTTHAVRTWERSIKCHCAHCPAAYMKICLCAISKVVLQAEWHAFCR